MTKYVNSGVIIFNKSHRNFFESFKQLYYDNSEKFIILQDKEVKKGQNKHLLIIGYKRIILN
jgi:hypothetical protein